MKKEIVLRKTEGKEWWVHDDAIQLTLIDGKKISQMQYIPDRGTVERWDGQSLRFGRLLSECGSVQMRISYRTTKTVLKSPCKERMIKKEHIDIDKLNNFLYDINAEELILQYAEVAIKKIEVIYLEDEF